MQRRYRADSDQWRLLKPAARQMRKAATPAEDAHWQALRGGRLAGIKFRRQHAIGPCIVDFFAPSPGLVVEVDGPVHEDQSDYDQSRDAVLRNQGVHILRFNNEDLLARLPWVLAQILSHCAAPEPSPDRPDETTP